MYVDEFGNWSIKKAWKKVKKTAKKVAKVAVAVTVVAAVTAATVATAGGVAVALGASVGVVSAVTTGAAVGGLVYGGLELGSQIRQNGVDGIRIKTLATETFIGSSSGAIQGAMASLPGTAKVGLSAANAIINTTGQIIHDINNGEERETIFKNIALNTAKGLMSISLAGFGKVKKANSSYINKILTIGILRNIIREINYRFKH